MNAKAIISALLLPIGLLTLVACGGSAPQEPTNERENILHEMPARYRVSLEAVRVAADAFTTSGEITYTSLGEPTQVIERGQVAGKGFTTLSERTDLTVRSSTADPGRAYIVRIEYFSPSDKPMNHQFIDGGQDKIHQHVFTYTVNNHIVHQANRIPWIYRYCDATPSDRTGILKHSDDNPIGFVGLMHFPQSSTEVKTMTIELLHAYGSKFDNGKPSPYYMIQRSKITHGRDINITIPVTITD